MSTARRVLRNTIIQLLGKVVTTVISLAVVVLITKDLGRDPYGQYTIALNYTAFFSVFTDLGINLYLVKQLSTPEANQEDELAKAFGFRIVTCALFLGLAWALAFILPYSQTIRAGISIALLAVFFQSLNSLFVSVLQANLEMPFAVLSETLGRVVMLVATISAIHQHSGVQGVLTAVALSGAANLLLTYIFTRRFLNIRIAWDTQAWMQVLHKSFLISIITILAYLYFKMDSVLLSILPLHNRNRDTEVAIYSFAYKILDILTLIPTIFLGNVFPVVNRLIASSDQKIHDVMQKSLNLLVILALPVTTALFVLAPKIILAISTEKFLPATTPLRILSLALLVFFFCQLFTDSLLALNRQRELMRIYAIATIFNLVTNLIFIPLYSYVAAATTTLLTQLIVLILPYIASRRAIGLKLRFSTAGKAALATTIMTLVLYFLRDTPLVISITIATFIYLALIFGSKTLTVTEMKTALARS